MPGMMAFGWASRRIYRGRQIVAAFPCRSFFHSTESADSRGEVLRLEQLSRKLEGTLTAEWVTRSEEILKRRMQLVSPLNAFTSWTVRRSNLSAPTSSPPLASSSQYPLLHWPIAVKDNFCVEGTITSCASRTLQDFVAPYTATVVHRLMENGAVMCGKTNMDEFAMGSSTTHCPTHGPSVNPWGHLPRIPGDETAADGKAFADAPTAASCDSPVELSQSPPLCNPPSWALPFRRRRLQDMPAEEIVKMFHGCLVAGGSSGGSAVAVASGCCIGALGSDTGGSVRQPASHCGVVGMKPTYGRLSRYGLIAFASSLDTPGIFADSVETCAAILDAVSGHDPLDPTSLREDALSTTRTLHQTADARSKGCDMRGVVIGVPKEYFVEELTAEAVNGWKLGIKALEERGARIESVSLPHTRYALPAYYIISSAEASSNLARYDGIEYGVTAMDINTKCSLEEQTLSMDELRSSGFGEEVQRRIVMGTFVLSRESYDVYYKKAQQVRRLVANDFKHLFEECGITCLLTPTAPSPPVTIPEQSLSERVLEEYANDVMTIPASLAGLPAISVPAHLSSNGRPMGLQVIANQLNETALLRVAAALESHFAFSSTYTPPNHIDVLSALEGDWVEQQ